MGYFIAAIVLGMLIWAGFEIVQTIRNWETNPEETTSKIQAVFDAVGAGFTNNL